MIPGNLKLLWKWKMNLKLSKIKRTKILKLNLLLQKNLLNLRKITNMTMR